MFRAFPLSHYLRCTSFSSVKSMLLSFGYHPRHFGTVVELWRDMWTIGKFEWVSCCYRSAPWPYCFMPLMIPFTGGFLFDVLFMCKLGWVNRNSPNDAEPVWKSVGVMLHLLSVVCDLHILWSGFYNISSTIILSAFLCLKGILNELLWIFKHWNSVLAVRGVSVFLCPHLASVSGLPCKPWRETSQIYKVI